MGPRLIGRGIDLVYRFGLFGSLASMGPRLIGRGIPRAWRPRSDVSPGFNGAAADRPRNCRISFASSGRSASFNGAAADRPRNSLISAAQLAALLASMGPRLIGRGIPPSLAGPVPDSG